MRLLTAALATALLVLPAAAVQAQDTASKTGTITAPTAADVPGAADAITEVERIRADFRARFVDYDLRLKALETRIEALESGTAAPVGAATPQPETKPKP